jgi:predicted extracellular nuclease
MKQTLLLFFAFLLFHLSSPGQTSLPFSEDFESTSGNGSTLIETDLTNWTNYTPTGNKGWTSNTYDNNKYAQMSSYNTGVANEAWIITPEIDISGITAVDFTFDVKIAYWTHNGLTILISENFDGTNVGSATWTDITSNFTIPQEPASGFGTFVNAGTMDISVFSGTVHIAFRYNGDDTNGETTTYQVDNINVYNATKPVIENISAYPAHPTSSDPVNISADVTDASGLDSVFTVWGTNSGSLTDTIGMSLQSGDTYITDSPIPQQTEETNVFYAINAVNINQDTTKSDEKQYTVIEELTISTIQSSLIGSSDSSQYTGEYINTSGIVTAILSNGYFIQDSKGPWNGIYIYDNSNSPSMGDQIDITAKVDEYYHLTELKNVSRYTLVSSGNELPALDTITTGEANLEKYESVLLRMEQAKCTADTAELGGGRWQIFNQGDSIYVEDNIFEYKPIKDQYYNVNGVAFYTYSERVILPRNSNDIEVYDSPPVINNINVNPQYPTSAESVSAFADITDESIINEVSLAWGTNSVTLDDTINMSNSSGDIYITDTDIPAHSDNTTIYYQVIALDDGNNKTVSQKLSFKINDPATTELPYSQMFNGNLGDIYTFSVTGETKEWRYVFSNNNGYAQANGYNSGVTEEDWLILPGINFDNYSNQLIMNFSSWYKYGTDNINNYLKLFYSSDYSGTGDPSSATWTEINYTQPANSETWKKSGNINLPDTAGKIYIGFKYHYKPNYYKLWKIDSINIYDASKPIIKNISNDPGLPTSNDAVNISAEVTDANGLDTVFTSWGTSINTPVDTIGMSLQDGDTYITDSPIPQNSPGTNVYFDVYAVNNNQDTTKSANNQYEIIEEVTISAIQSNTIGSSDSSEYTGNYIRTSGVVTGLLPNGYVIQDGKGEWNGIYVYESNNSPSIGDKIKITAKVDEYNHLTELKNVSRYTLISSGNSLPAADTITTGKANLESYESVLVRVEQAECTADNNDLGSGRWQIFNEGDSILVDDIIYSYTPTKDEYYHVNGIAFYFSGERKILPRNSNDIEINASPVISNTNIIPAEPASTDAISVKADITDDISVEEVHLLWGYASGSLENTIQMTLSSGDTYQTASSIPKQNEGDTVYYKVYASDGDKITESTGSFMIQIIPPDITNISTSPSEPGPTDKISVSADVNDDSSIDAVYAAWGASPETLEDTIPMTLSSGDTYQTASSIPKQNEGDTVYFKIYASDGESISESSGNVQVKYIAPAISNISTTPAEPGPTDKISISANVNDDSPIDTVYTAWGVSSGQLDNTIPMSLESGDTYKTTDSIPKQDGGTTIYYKITAKDVKVSNTSEELSFTVTDETTAIISKQSLTLKVYPNPGKGQYSVEIDSKVANSYRVAVFNTVGKMVYQKQFNDHSVKQTINLTDQNDGIYFLKVTGKNTNKVIKLIKE